MVGKTGFSKGHSAAALATTLLLAIQAVAQAPDGEPTPGLTLIDEAQAITGTLRDGAVWVTTTGSILTRNLTIVADSIRIDGDIRGLDGTSTNPDGSGIRLLARRELVINGSVQAGDGFTPGPLGAHDGGKAVGRNGGNGGSIHAVATDPNSTLVLGPKALVRAGMGGNGQNVSWRDRFDALPDLAGPAQAVAGNGGHGGSMVLASMESTLAGRFAVGRGGNGGVAEATAVHAVNYVTDDRELAAHLRPRPLEAHGGHGGVSGTLLIDGLTSLDPQQLLAAEGQGGDGGDALSQVIPELANVPNEWVRLLEPQPHASSSPEPQSEAQEGTCIPIPGTLPGQTGEPGASLCSDPPIGDETIGGNPGDDTPCDDHQFAATPVASMAYSNFLSLYTVNVGAPPPSLTQDAFMLASQAGFVCRPGSPGSTGIAGFPALAWAGDGGTGLMFGGKGGDGVARGGEGNHGLKGEDGHCGFIQCQKAGEGGQGGAGGAGDAIAGSGGGAIAPIWSQGGEGGTAQGTGGTGGKGGEGGSWSRVRYALTDGDLFTVETHGCNLFGECVQGAPGGVAGQGGPANVKGGHGGNAHAFNIFAPGVPLTPYTMPFWVFPTTALGGKASDPVSATQGKGGEGGKGGLGGRCDFQVHVMPTTPAVTLGPVVPANPAVPRPTLSVGPAQATPLPVPNPVQEVPALPIPFVGDQDVPIPNCQGGDGGSGGQGGMGGKGAAMAHHGGEANTYFEGATHFVIHQMALPGAQAILESEGGGKGGEGGAGGLCYLGTCADGGLGGLGGLGGDAGQAMGGAWMQGENNWVSDNAWFAGETGYKGLAQATGVYNPDNDAPGGLPGLVVGGDGGHATGTGGPGGEGGLGGVGGRCSIPEIPGVQIPFPLCKGGQGGSAGNASEGGTVDAVMGGDGKDHYDINELMVFPTDGGNALITPGTGGPGGSGGNGGDGLCGGSGGSAGSGGKAGHANHTDAQPGKPGKAFGIHWGHGGSSDVGAGNGGTKGTLGQQGSSVLGVACPLFASLTLPGADGAAGFASSVPGQPPSCAVALPPDHCVMLQENLTSVWENPVFHCFMREGFVPLDLYPTTLSVQHYCDYGQWVARMPVFYNAAYALACVYGTLYPHVPEFAAACSQYIAEGFSTLGGDWDNWFDEGPEPFPCVQSDGMFAINCGMAMCPAYLLPAPGTALTEQRAQLSDFVFSYYCDGPREVMCSFGPMGQGMDGGGSTGFDDTASTWIGDRDRGAYNDCSDIVVDGDHCAPVRWSLIIAYGLIDHQYSYPMFHQPGEFPESCFPPSYECVRPEVVMLLYEECLLEGIKT